MRNWLIIAIAASILCAAGVPAQEAAAANPEAKERYIVVFQRGNDFKGADEAALRADVHYRLEGWSVISVPAAAVQALRSHPHVKYIQKSVMYEEEVPIPQVFAESEKRAVALPGENSAVTWTSGDYVYDGVGNIAGIGTTAAPGTGNRRQTYRYDGISRLRVANTVTGTETADEAFTYDIYGNMRTMTYKGVASTVQTDEAKNQLAAGMGADYDEAGNLIAHGSEQYRYDPTNMMTEKLTPLGPTEFYVYTADDERVGVIRNGLYWTWSLRGLDGKVLRQYKSVAGSSADWLWLKDYVYRGSQLLGTQRVAAEGGRRHFHLDHLGSARVITNTNAEVTSLHDYRPFGAESTAMNQDVADGLDSEEPMDFTGHERDFTGGTDTNNENYLDYMHARFYMPKWGRFLSVDPARRSAVLRLPRSWNRYSYALNNPVSITDPTGRYPCRYKLTGTDAEIAGVDDGTVVDGTCVEAEADSTTAEEAMAWVEEHEAFLQAMADASSGFADTITFTGTKHLRKRMGDDHAVNPCSGFYLGGEVAGTVWWIAFAGGIGSELGGGNLAAREFGQITLTDAAYAARGLEGLTDAQKLTALGGMSGSFVSSVTNVFKPAWWKAVANTTTTTGLTPGSWGGVAGIPIGGASVAANEMVSDCY